MSIPQQEEVLLSIYSIDYLLRCLVIDSSEKVVRLAPVSGKVDMFQLYDPVVLLQNDCSNGLNIIPADVYEIDDRQSIVTLNLRSAEVPEERRLFERHPVSLAVSARRKFSSKRIHLAVRNISLYGMCVVSQADLEVDELIDIDLITDRNMFFFSGQVIWKNTIVDDCSEYGLKLTSYDIATKSSFEEFLGRQKEFYLSLIPKAR